MPLWVPITYLARLEYWQSIATHTLVSVPVLLWYLIPSDCGQLSKIDRRAQKPIIHQLMIQLVSGKIVTVVVCNVLCEFKIKPAPKESKLCSFHTWQRFQISTLPYHINIVVLEFRLPYVHLTVCWLLSKYFLSRSSLLCWCEFQRNLNPTIYC